MEKEEAALKMERWWLNVKNDCAMVESKLSWWFSLGGEWMGRWVGFTGTNESHNLEVGKRESRKWKDSHSGKGGKLRPQEMDGLLRGAKVQQRAGGEMYQPTISTLPAPGSLWHDAAFLADVNFCFSISKWCVRRHGWQETIEPAGWILMALIESQPWSTLTEPVWRHGWNFFAQVVGSMTGNARR